MASKFLSGANFHQASIYELPLQNNMFDLVICLQTISWIEDPRNALKELIRICKPNGTIIVSFLCNINHDVDLYTTIIDHTRSRAGSKMTYNTFCAKTIGGWLADLVFSHTIHPFSIDIDLPNPRRGVGTYTIPMKDGNRIEISAGYLMNWGFLEIVK